MHPYYAGREILHGNCDLANHYQHFQHYSLYKNVSCKHMISIFFESIQCSIVRLLSGFPNPRTFNVTTFIISY